MNQEQLKSTLLEHLADDWNRNGPRPVDMQQFSKQIGIPFEQVRGLVCSLAASGAVETVVGEGHAILTARGFDLARPSDPAATKTGGTHVNFHGPVSGSAVAVDRSNATVSSFEISHQNFCSELAKAVETSPDVEPDRKRQWCNALLEMSHHPVVVEALRTLLPH